LTALSSTSLSSYPVVNSTHHLQLLAEEPISTREIPRQLSEAAVGAAAAEDLASVGPEVAADHHATGGRVVKVLIPIGPGPIRVPGRPLRVAIVVVHRRTDLDRERLPDGEVAEEIAITIMVATMIDAAVPAMIVTGAAAALVVTKGLIGDLSVVSTTRSG
jgi:hypothetical protein